MDFLKRPGSTMSSQHSHGPSQDNLRPESALSTPSIPVSRPDSPFRWQGSDYARKAGATTPSVMGSTSAFHMPGNNGDKFFRSRRIKDITQISKPWTEKKDTKKKWHWIIPLIGMGIGIGLICLELYTGLSSVVNHDYCLVLSEDFSTQTALNNNIWTKEVQLGGYGNGQFEVTTNTDENIFFKEGALWIKPTLQDASLINNNNVLDLTQGGLCTSTLWTDCHAVTNTTNGTIINPVKSGRINTKKGASIQYGRIEVEALLPSGDWMWPAIWMMPVDDVYGAWPASGEIDVAESRGNNYSYPLGGNDVISSTLHWGPNAAMDAWYHTYIKKQAEHTTYAKKWHTFGLEWSEKYLFTYIDGRLYQALYVPFTEPLWPQGHFDSATENGTRVVDPWSQTGHASTPFDQKFYLILDVAVGSTNGWWTDGVAGKPWVDASPTAMRDFWQAQSQWYPTWKDNGQMQIKTVKMWQQSGYQGCNGK